jgi:hypothetical protein
MTRYNNTNFSAIDLFKNLTMLLFDFFNPEKSRVFCKNYFIFFRLKKFSICQPDMRIFSSWRKAEIEKAKARKQLPTYKLSKV